MNPSSFNPESTRDYFNLDSSWITVGDERVHLHEAGTGTPIILLHGSAVGASAAANWWRTIPALAKIGRVIAPDISGYGWTESNRERTLSIPVWADDVVRLMDALQLPSAILVGNSLGGRIAMQVAVDHPDRVAGLVTMGSPGISYESSPTLTANAKPDFTVEGIARVMRNLAADGFDIPVELAEFRYRMATRPGAPERWQRVVADRDSSVAEHRLTENDLRALVAPTLILHGREDKVIAFDEAIETARFIPAADLAIFADCGHWVQLEREHEFLELVTGLVARVRRTR